MPSASSARVTARCARRLPKLAQTWVNTTSLATRAPSIAAMPAAKPRRARIAVDQGRDAGAAEGAQTAHTGTPRARRETSGTNSNGSPAASLNQVLPVHAHGGAQRGTSRTMAMPQS